MTVGAPIGKRRPRSDVKGGASKRSLAARRCNRWSDDEDARLKMALVVEPALTWDQVAQIVGTRNASMCNSRASRRHIREAVSGGTLPPRRPFKHVAPQTLPSDDTFLLDFDIESMKLPQSEHAMRVLTDHELLQEFDLHYGEKALESNESIDDDFQMPSSKGSFTVRIADASSAADLADGPVLRAAVSMTLGSLGGRNLSFTYADWKRREPRGGAPRGRGPQAPATPVLAGKITDFWARRKAAPAPKPIVAAPRLVLKQDADLPLAPVPNYSAADRSTATVMQARATTSAA